jgi:tetratricopeptide (TPR) repeat protein
MRKIAEGEIIVHTQKSGQNVDQLRQYLASLRAESQRTSTNLDQLAKSIFAAGRGGFSLGRIIKGLASAAGFGGAGAVGYLAFNKVMKVIGDTRDETAKLAETLNNAIGVEGENSIEGISQKMQGLTKAINETRTAIGEQGLVNSIVSFFYNEDADRAAKAFEKAVETRIALGDKLTQQEAERIAQQKILMGLDGDMAEVFKINIETRKKLAQIEANDALSAQQKIDQARLAGEERADKLRALRTKKEKEEAKKSFEERKKLDEDFARTSFKINDSLVKQEEELFKKNAEAFKKSQEEMAKAAEDANKRIIDSSKRAAEQIQKQDDEARKKFEEARGIDEAFLGASRPGRQALDVARNQRIRQVSREDFKTQDAFLQAEASRLSGIEGIAITKQDVRKRMARRVAAGEMPTLMERLQGTAAGIDPSQVARSREIEKGAGAGQGSNDSLKSLFLSLQKSISDLAKKIPAAVPQ